MINSFNRYFHIFLDGNENIHLSLKKYIINSKFRLNFYQDFKKIQLKNSFNFYNFFFSRFTYKKKKSFFFEKFKELYFQNILDYIFFKLIKINISQISQLIEVMSLIVKPLNFEFIKELLMDLFKNIIVKKKINEVLLLQNIKSKKKIKRKKKNLILNLVNIKFLKYLNIFKNKLFYKNNNNICNLLNKYLIKFLFRFYTKNFSYVNVLIIKELQFFCLSFFILNQNLKNFNDFILIINNNKIKIFILLEYVYRHVFFPLGSDKFLNFLQKFLYNSSFFYFNLKKYWSFFLIQLCNFSIKYVNLFDTHNNTILNSFNFNYLSYFLYINFTCNKELKIYDSSFFSYNELLIMSDVKLYRDRQILEWKEKKNSNIINIDFLSLNVLQSIKIHEKVKEKKKEKEGVDLELFDKMDDIIDIVN